MRTRFSSGIDRRDMFGLELIRQNPLALNPFRPPLEDFDKILSFKVQLSLVVITLSMSSVHSPPLSDFPLFLSMIARQIFRLCLLLLMFFLMSVVDNERSVFVPGNSDLGVNNYPFVFLPSTKFILNIYF